MLVAGLWLAGLWLAGCGFEPLYAARGPASVGDDLAAVRVAPIANRSGQILRNYLVDSLAINGQSASPRYTLHVSVEEPRGELTIRRDDTPSRFAYTVTARFRLADGAGRTLYNGVASFDSDYEVTNSEFATLANRLNVRDRLLQQASEDIRLQLAQFFRGRQSSG
jgi:LPS-assembly lipoprotein